MKQLIKKAGFSSQKEVAHHLDKNEKTIVKWVKIKPKFFVEYLKLRRIHSTIIKSGILIDEQDEYVEFTIEGKKIKVVD